MEAYAITDVGMNRSTNQDYIFASTMPLGSLSNLFIVADGMGGHKAGVPGQGHTWNPEGGNPESESGAL